MEHPHCNRAGKGRQRGRKGHSHLLRDCTEPAESKPVSHLQRE